MVVDVSAFISSPEHSLYLIKPCMLTTTTPDHSVPSHVLSCHATYSLPGRRSSDDRHNIASMQDKPSLFSVLMAITMTIAALSLTFVSFVDVVKVQEMQYLTAQPPPGSMILNLKRFSF